MRYLDPLEETLDDPSCIDDRDSFLGSTFNDRVRRLISCIRDDDVDQFQVTINLTWNERNVNKCRLPRMSISNTYIYEPYLSIEKRQTHPALLRWASSLSRTLVCSKSTEDGGWWRVRFCRGLSFSLLALLTSSLVASIRRVGGSSREAGVSVQQRIEWSTSNWVA